MHSIEVLKLWNLACLSLVVMISAYFLVRIIEIWTNPPQVLVGQKPPFYCALSWYTDAQNLPFLPEATARPNAEVEKPVCVW